MNSDEEINSINFAFNPITSAIYRKNNEIEIFTEKKIDIINNP
jgi:hypothetical protein